jgi:hypothetical protein
MSEVTKEEALTHITQAFRYMMRVNANTHPFVRDLSVIIQKTWGQSGTMAVQAVQREKNARTKDTAPVVNVTEKPALVKFVHPKSPEAASQVETPVPAFQPPPPKAQEVEGQETPRRGRKQKVQLEETPNQAVHADDVNPVAVAEPLNNSELSAVKGMGVREILSEFGEARLSATLEILEIDYSELSGSQKAAAVKANAGK